MQYGTRNQFDGKVVFIRKGEIMSEVILEVNKDVYVTSVLTTSSLNDLNIIEDMTIKALVKAVDVVLVKA
jgi:molybdopterin-binding protein